MTSPGEIAVVLRRRGLTWSKIATTLTVEFGVPADRERARVLALTYDPLIDNLPPRQSRYRPGSADHERLRAEAAEIATRLARVSGLVLRPRAS